MSGKTALLLVDCQQDYLARDGLLPPREILVPAIAGALISARAKGWPVFHVRTDGSDPMPHRRSAPEVVAGTPGAEPPEELREKDGEPVLFKRYFSAFGASELEAELRSRDVEQLVLAGVHSHACIQATALDAYARGIAVTIPEELVGSDSPAHGRQALDWLNGRAATLTSSAATLRTTEGPWQHRNPCDWDEVLEEVTIQHPTAVAERAGRLRQAVPLPLTQRAERLRGWHQQLTADRERFVQALVRDLGKPRRDAEGEVAYGLALLDRVAATLADEEANTERRVRYAPHGVAGLITPWNNPFAIPVGKLAPAIGYGNTALWKPALPGSGIAALLATSLDECGLGEYVALVTGDGSTGQAVLAHSDLVSFTGSVAVGNFIIAEAGRRAIPVQAELGGSNGAIIDASADLDSAAEDLAAAMFSFAGQRCTAIRRVIVIDEVHDFLVDRLVAAVEALRIGQPGDPATQVGPVIDKGRQQAFLALAEASGSLVTGGAVPASLPASGCWVEPAVLAEVPAQHPLLAKEVFGPLAAIIRVPDLAAAIAAHNATGMGLLGALYSQDEQAKTRFLAEAQAGIVSLNRARPPFTADGPFVGWKDSGHGIPEHGRWNRDFYTRAQVIYGD